MIRINSLNFKQEKERKILKSILLGISDVFCLYKNLDQHQRIELQNSPDATNENEPKDLKDC